jgi:cell division protein FtsQ
VSSARERALAAARSWAAAVWRRRRVRLSLLGALGALALALGGWLFLRHSSLAAVERVQISGARGADARQIDAALSRAARGMSTLDVKRGVLLAAVARFHVVRELSLSPSFPHGLRIRVIEQPPVAVLLAGGTRTAVAADGVVLGPALLAGSLPSVDLDGVAPLPGQRVARAGTRAELRVLGAAPQTLLGWVQRVYTGPEGLTVAMRGGLELYFGNATRPHAKWLAAARVLADPSSAGASYVDVRLPERPAAGSAAAGGLTAGDSASTQVSASDPSAAALAATLDEAVAGGSNASAAASTPSGVATATTPAEPAAAGGESPAATAPATTEPSISSSG